MKNITNIFETKCLKCWMLSQGKITSKCKVFETFYHNFSKKPCFAFCETKEEYQRRMNDIKKCKKK